MRSSERARLVELVQYPEESAGGLVQTELVRLRPDHTVAGATA